MTGIDQLAAHVTAGARLLDEKRPGWWHEVNPETIHTAGCLDDVLGQVYGGWNTGMNTLFATDTDSYSIISDLAITHGFEAPETSATDAADSELIHQEYRDLDDLWQQEVIARQDRDQAGDQLAPA